MGVARYGDVSCAGGLAIKSGQVRKEHTQDSDHQGKVLATLKSKGRMVDISCISILFRNTRVLDLASSADRLQSLNWKLQVQGVIYQYMVETTTSSISTEPSLIVQAKTLLEKYEQMERLSLLELPVGKAACISRVEIDPETHIKTLHDAILCVANSHHIWKNYRAETRKTNAAEIIIQHVLPFLGEPCGLLP